MSSHENINSGASLELVINKALKKIHAKNEWEICRYLPGESGCYIHHFTMKKMKTKAPEELKRLITTHIINKEMPVKFSHKPRSPYIPKKYKKQFDFTRQDLYRMRKIAHLVGDVEMVRKLSHKEDPDSIKKELIDSINQGKAEQGLWEMYVDLFATGHKKEEIGELTTSMAC